MVKAKGMAWKNSSEFKNLITATEEFMNMSPTDGHYAQTLSNTMQQLSSYYKHKAKDGVKLDKATKAKLDVCERTFNYLKEGLAAKHIDINELANINLKGFVIDENSSRIPKGETEFERNINKAQHRIEKIAIQNNFKNKNASKVDEPTLGM